MNRIDLKEENLPTGKPAFYGTESKLYRTFDNKLFKYFSPGVATKEKLEKLKILSQLNMNENIFRDLVFFNDEFIGYTMDNLEIKGYKLINPFEQRFSNKRIDVTKKVWQRLEEFHKLGIIYGDIHNYNILYNGKDIIFCDMDSVKIDKYSLDRIGDIQKKYLFDTKFKYEFIDNFMFNYFFYGYYLNIYGPYVYSHLLDRNLEKRIDNYECMQIIYDMTNLNNDYNGELFIDHLNDTLPTKVKKIITFK